ncbi:MAG: hypothetical protein EBE86_022375 [Hormoscilla sp. GUM202]|nr:hypothetical protein [Hormoscilla sp. GUM202]
MMYRRYGNNSSKSIGKYDALINMEKNSIKEIILLVEEDPEGGFIAKAIG